MGLPACLLAQLHRPDGRGEVVGDRLDQLLVVGVEPVRMLVGDHERGRARPLDHHRSDQHGVVGVAARPRERRVVAGPAQAQHLAGCDRGAGDAGSRRDAQADVDVGAAIAREDGPALAPDRLDDPGGQAGVAGVAADGLGGVVQSLVDALG